MGPNVFFIKNPLRNKQELTQEKREKSEGIRDTAEAEWKKRNLP
jgi:hypothetical protein